MPVVHTDLSGTSPSVDGTIRVTNARDYAIDGYVQTSHGRVTTSLHSTLDFTNYQRYSNESETTGDLSATQTMTATTMVLTRSAKGTAVHEDTVSFPVSVALATVLDATVTGSQRAKVEQHFSHAQGDLDASGFRASLESNEVSSADTLLIADGGISGNSGQHSGQTYVAFDMGGYCYAKSLTAKNNVLATDARTTCDAKAAAQALRALHF
ncbi:MAG: hypothetical protein IAI49_08020 [Candidatus Eremiobacteraeota bacterium]|nr:hypothetical protein [Candidatus Eremiobacteraeota bacterium]